MTNYTNKWIIKKKEELKKEFGNKCQICGSKEKLEFAHIKPTKLFGNNRGRKERYYDVKNNKESYMFLCKECHKEMDKK